MSSQSSIRKHYQKLLNAFGHQGWWPTTPADSPCPVYVRRRSLARLTEQERFEICLGAILTQNTSWSNVDRVLRGLKACGVLSLERLARQRLPRLQKLLRSSGYFRQKAERVKRFLDEIRRAHGGRFDNFFAGSLNAARRRLLDLNGVGPETADSMLLYAAGAPIFVVDAYTRRIGARWGVFKGTEPYEEIQKIFMRALPRSAVLYAEYHALLVKLGKDICRPQPRCQICPLNDSCQTGKRRVYGR